MAWSLTGELLRRKGARTLSPMMLRIRPDKISSSCIPFGFGPYLNVDLTPTCREGAATVCRVITERSHYGELELTSGRISKLIPGDIIVGVLGNRAALRGFSGRVPDQVAQGDELSLLNMGGVLGVTEGRMVGLGEPIKVEVIGTPLLKGAPALLHEFSLPDIGKVAKPPALIAVAGTCMNSGKSTACSAIIRELKSKGLVVHAGKATGVAAIRDPLSFRDHGANLALSFLDCGIPSTARRKDTPEICIRLLDHLSADEPDAIILELGDGLMGAYGVDEILEDPEIKSRITGVILAANDVVGGWAGVQQLRALGLNVICVTGPATDNLAGIEKFESLGVPAANILREPRKMFDLTAAALEAAK